MKCKLMKFMSKLLQEVYGDELAQKIVFDANARLDELCKENVSFSKEQKVHLYEKILPTISVYEALQKNGIKKDEAYHFLDDALSKDAENGADSLKRILKHMGLYQLYPGIFQYVAKKQFGVKAGFEAKFYDYGKKRCKFDMTKCFFLDSCERYGCKELTQCFCHTDDISNADLHPKLCWNRSQFMGNGGEICDFDIYVTDESNNTGHDLK